MARIKVGKLELDPAKNPAVLDTTRWDRATAVSEVQAVGAACWGRATGAIPLPVTHVAPNFGVAENGSACAGKGLAESTARLENWLLEIADDLFGRGNAPTL